MRSGRVEDGGDGSRITLLRSTKKSRLETVRKEMSVLIFCFLNFHLIECGFRCHRYGLCGTVSLSTYSRKTRLLEISPVHYFDR